MNFDHQAKDGLVVADGIRKLLSLVPDSLV